MTGMRVQNNTLPVMRTCSVFFSLGPALLCVFLYTTFKLAGFPLQRQYNFRQMNKLADRSVPSIRLPCHMAISRTFLHQPCILHTWPRSPDTLPEIDRRMRSDPSFLESPRHALRLPVKADKCVSCRGLRGQSGTADLRPFERQCFTRCHTPL